MSAVKNPPLAYYYSWQNVPDNMILNIMTEFKDNGVDHLVFSHHWITRILQEPLLYTNLKRYAYQLKMQIIEVHAPWGQCYDLACIDKARRPYLIADHKKAMAYAAESGCRTYTMHIGAYESVFYKTPNEELRKYAVDTLEQLLPEAEKLDLILAVENSYERSNTPDEAAYYIEYFNSPFIGCCFDVGHANLMSPFPGKQREKYFDEMDLAWGETVEEYSGAYEKLAPYIVTCHLHDNNGYADSHQLPGTGIINWKELIANLRKCPRLLSMQTETGTDGLSIRKLTDTFRSITAE